MSFVRVRDRDTGHHYSLPEGHHLLKRDLVDVLDREPTALHMPAKPNTTRSVPEGEPDETWTVKQLRTHAEQVGVSVDSHTTKADILAALIVAPAASTEGA